MTSRRPSGTVTFVFTDIEGSTRLAQSHREAWEGLRARHHAILRHAFEGRHGYVFEIVGDAFCVAFDRPIDALLAAIEAQRVLDSEAWDPAPLRVRMGIHAGPAEVAGTGYRGYVTLTSSQRVMSAAHGGQILLSQSSFDLVQNDLPDDTILRDLGEHRLKDLRHPQHLYQVMAPELPADFPPLRTLDVPLNNLPVQLTTFIGRELELAQVKALFDRARLVTLTGAGGAGKTRLAIQVARELASHFPDGVWFLGLAPVQDASAVPGMLQSLLQIRGTVAGRSFGDLLRDQLYTRHLLLVIDNCEHLVEACAGLAHALLTSCPDVRILATSREPLRVDGEIPYRVPSLEVPVSGEQPDPRELEACASVRLFVDRAMARSRSFEISAGNAASIAEICRRLDGIPLAIELAAGRVGGLPIATLAANLNDRFEILTGGSRVDLPRHQTLRLMIDWSYALLSGAEKTLLRRLGVFYGGWTMEAAQAVAADEELHASDIRQLLSALVEKSLVEFDGARNRYYMLETIRLYALERLREAGEEPEFRIRHVDYFTQEAEASDPLISKSDMSAVVLARDSHNIVSAIRWCESTPGEIPRGLRLIGASRWIWYVLYQIEPIYSLARRFLAQPEAAPRTSHRWAALMLTIQGGSSLGLYPQLRPQIEECLSIARELQDARLEVHSLMELGSMLAETGDLPGAVAYLEQAVAIARDHGLPRMLAGCLNSLGEMSRAAGDFARARELYEESMSMAQQAGGQGPLFLVLCNLTATIIQTGDLAAAAPRLEQALDLLEELPWLMAKAEFPLFVSVGYLAAAGQFRNAAVLHGAAEHHRALEGKVIEHTDRQFIEPLLEDARQGLGSEEFDAAVKEGSALSLEQAVALARAWLTSA